MIRAVWWLDDRFWAFVWWLDRLVWSRVPPLPLRRLAGPQTLACLSRSWRFRRQLYRVHAVAAYWPPGWARKPGARWCRSVGKIWRAGFQLGHRHWHIHLCVSLAEAPRES